MLSKLKLTKADIIITVFNESGTIGNLISALKKQTVQPKAVIIVDGGSTDGTYAKLKEESKKWSVLQVYQIAGNRSVGRNYAISHGRSPIIVITDAGCIPEPNWLEEIVKPFSDPQTRVVSGFYKGIPQNIFQKCLIPYVLVMPDKAGKTEFFPSTRSMAIRRSVWDQSGGFDTKLNHNEDYAYAHWLKNMGIKFIFSPKAIVGWIPRKNLHQTAWMFTRFAIGDVQSKIIRPKVKLLFIRYLIFVYFFMLCLQIKILFIPLGIICLMYLSWSIVKNYRYVRHPMAFIWLPVLQLTADISVIFGSMVGFMAKINGLF